MDKREAETDSDRRKASRRFPWVEPMMMKRNIIVRTSSATRQEARLYLPGECEP